MKLSRNFPLSSIIELHAAFRYSKTILAWCSLISYRDYTSNFFVKQEYSNPYMGLLSVASMKEGGILPKYGQGRVILKTFLTELL